MTHPNDPRHPEFRGVSRQSVRNASQVWQVVAWSSDPNYLHQGIASYPARASEQEAREDAEQFQRTGDNTQWVYQHYDVVTYAITKSSTGTTEFGPVRVITAPGEYDSLLPDNVLREGIYYEARSSGPTAL